MARRNARYLQLLLVNFLQKIGEGIGLGSFAYFVVYYVRLPIGTIGPIVVGTLAGQILSQPLWVLLNPRLGRPVVYTVGVVGWILTLLVSLTLAGAPLWKMVLIGISSGITGGGFLGVMLMMLADSISHDAEATGIKREGTYSGIWLATEKIGLAVGALLVGSVLGIFHFVSSTGGIDAPEPAEALLGIAIVYVGVNSLVYAASIVPVWRYARLSAEPATAATAATAEATAAG